MSVNGVSAILASSRSPYAAAAADGRPDQARKPSAKDTAALPAVLALTAHPAPAGQQLDIAKFAADLGPHLKLPGVAEATENTVDWLGRAFGGLFGSVWTVAAAPAEAF